MFFKEIVYIAYGFKTIQVKWKIVFLFRIPYIQTLRRRKSESMVNCTPIKSAQSIFVLISPVVKLYRPLPSPITC